MKSPRNYTVNSPRFHYNSHNHIDRSILKVDHIGKNNYFQRVANKSKALPNHHYNATKIYRIDFDQESIYEFYIKIASLAIILSLLIILVVLLVSRKRGYFGDRLRQFKEMERAKKGFIRINQVNSESETESEPENDFDKHFENFHLKSFSS